MNLKNRIIVEDYRKCRGDFVKLEGIVCEKLEEIVKETGIAILKIEHRVKTEKSLAGKLERKGDWYQSLSDLTDLLGARVICFFNDEVETIGKAVEKAFEVEWRFSSDKKELLDVDRFGYLSLHYICTLTEDMGYPPEVCGKFFEIQIRTNLQHTWSSIEHDLGYKSEFGVPKVVLRDFARLAGLLELADDEFARVRDNMNAYTEDIRKRIIDNCANDVNIDMISLSEYMKRNLKMREFLSSLAGFCGAEIREVSSDSYIEQLLWFGKSTLGDLQTMLEQNREVALQLAEKALRNSNLDIIASTVGLRYLCRAELFNKKYTQEQAVEFFKISTGNEERAKRQAKYTFDSFKKLSCSE